MGCLVYVQAATDHSKVRDVMEGWGAVRGAQF